MCGRAPERSKQHTQGKRDKCIEVEVLVYKREVLSKHRSIQQTFYQCTTTAVQRNTFKPVVVTQEIARVGVEALSGFFLASYMPCPPQGNIKSQGCCCVFLFVSHIWLFPPKHPWGAVATQLGVFFAEKTLSKSMVHTHPRALTDPREGLRLAGGRSKKGPPGRKNKR